MAKSNYRESKNTNSNVYIRSARNRKPSAETSEHFVDEKRVLRSVFVPGF